MSPPLSIVEEEGSNGSIEASSGSTDSTCQNNVGLKERNYMGFSDSSSVDSSAVSSLSQEKDTSLNLKATELRLGLPGSQSPVREPELCLLSSTKLDEKPLFPLHPSKDGIFSTLPKTVVSGNKRGFSDAMDGFSEEKFNGNTGMNSIALSRTLPVAGGKPASVKEQSGGSSAVLKEIVTPKVSQDRTRGPGDINHNQSGSNNNGNAPAAKAQVVGWPPIRSFRKNTLATTSKNNEEVDGKPSSGALFVKVSMDGAPYLRKVDLKTYETYLELSSALEKMFSCFTIGQYGSHGFPGRDMLSESKLKDLLHGSEYVLTYEDKDGDWMLVGDVPWEDRLPHPSDEVKSQLGSEKLGMFTDTCKRLRIMKSADAIGLAPRAMEKCRNRN
ncbi:hypothetical protein ACLOJK_036154 [Asimina triloba]